MCLFGKDHEIAMGGWNRLDLTKRDGVFITETPLLQDITKSSNPSLQFRTLLH